MVGQDHDTHEPSRTGGPETPDAARGMEDDEVRRKFLETLQRKQRHHQARHLAGGASYAEPKLREGAGPARARREFRRKRGS